MNFFQDLRYGFRTLRSSPGFLALAVATLGLGIAANTAIFSLFYQVLLRSLPVSHPERLVALHAEDFGMPGRVSKDTYETVYSYPLYRTFRDSLHSFDGVAARSGQSLQLLADGSSERVVGEVVSGNFFGVLGIQPRLGRLLIASDDRVMAGNPVAVLSFDYWTKRFGASPSTLNRTITLNGTRFTIVGIAPEGFRGIQSGNSPEVYVPLATVGVLDPEWKDYDRPNLARWAVLARLRDGVQRQRAEAEIQPRFAAAIQDEMTQLKVTNPRARKELSRTRVQLVSASQGLNELERQWRKPLLALASMVALLLLIGCANLANILLARGVNRSRDTAIRLALGAGRPRIVSMLLAESLLVAVGGALVGIALTPLLTAGVLRLLPSGQSGGWLTGAVSIPVLVFCTALMVVTGIVSGIVPAWQSALTSEGSVLGDRTASTSGGHLSPRVRQGLVAGQLALSLVLLSTAGLFGRSLFNLMRHNPGFRAENVLTFSVDAADDGYTVDRGVALYREIAKRLRVLPGVSSVSLADAAPLSNSEGGTNVTVEGYTPGPAEEADSDFNSVGPAFFRTLGTPLISGREFDEHDVPGALRVVVVSQAFVNRYFKGRNPLGMHMKQGAGSSKLDLTIVGVVPDLKNMSMRETAKPTFYLAYDQSKVGATSFRAAFIVRAANADALTSSARGLVAQLDRTLPVFDTATMQTRIDDSLYTDRLLAALSTAFGLLAMTLTAVGLYGVIAYAVGRRTAEIGIRMALGATRTVVVTLVLREVGILIGLGVLAGVFCSIASTRAVQSQLFGVEGFDPLVFAATVLILVIVSLAAGALPALRAANIQPLAALRHA